VKTVLNLVGKEKRYSVFKKKIFVTHHVFLPENFQIFSFFISYSNAQPSSYFFDVESKFELSSE
jgi:hypothetical protein